MFITAEIFQRNAEISGIHKNILNLWSNHWNNRISAEDQSWGRFYHISNVTRWNRRVRIISDESQNWLGYRGFSGLNHNALRLEYIRHDGGIRDYSFAARSTVLWVDFRTSFNMEKNMQSLTGDSLRRYIEKISVISGRDPFGLKKRRMVWRSRHFSSIDILWYGELFGVRLKPFVQKQ